MEGKKANIHQVIRKVILHVRKQERNVSTTELDESWRLIEKQIHATKRKSCINDYFMRQLIHQLPQSCYVCFGWVNSSSLITMQMTAH